MTEAEQVKAVMAREHPPSRVVIDEVQPTVDGGRFPIRRTVGEEVVVTADIFAEEFDVLAAVIRHRDRGTDQWQEVAMTALGNDAWTGRFRVPTLGWHEYTITAWVDRFASWYRELAAKAQAGQGVASELLEGSEFIRAASRRAGGTDAERLRERAERLGRGGDQAPRIVAALDPELSRLMALYPDRDGSRTYEPTQRIMVERERARSGPGCEMFPRAWAFEPGRHGTLKDIEARLPSVAALGFDVAYLGRAIGAAEGGHKAILPGLGTLDDFHRLADAARRLGIELALDIDLRCSPDHPYVREHPGWFRHRPDGTIKHAEDFPENSPDISFDFDCADWKNLWEELKSIFVFWVRHGVKVFRVDSPHTQPFRFWEWIIGEVWGAHPDVIFLAEAFPRPKVLRHLAKLGFSQWPGATTS